MASVLVESPRGPIKANLIFDSGADKSFATEDLAKRAKGSFKGSVDLTCATFGGGKTSNVCDVFELNVHSTHVCASAEPARIQVVAVPEICAQLKRPKVPAHLLQPFQHLQLAAECTTEALLHIDIVIGQDQYWSLVRSGLLRSPDGVVAMETRFGWVLSGAVECEGGSQGSEGPPAPVQCGVGCQLLLLTQPTPRVDKMWSWDECRADDDVTECAVLDKFNSTIQHDGERYVVQMPWKEDRGQLKDNLEAATKRLVSLERKLQQKPQLQKEYDAALQQMEADGVVCEVPPAEEREADRVVYYMPHRPVVKMSSATTKVRPVFDASARGVNGVSLNDVVETGPALMPNLLDVLLRFRRWRFGLTADIKRAFYQIALRSQDQDAVRFLWRVGDRMRHMRFQRVVMGVACSPFLLNATIRHHLARCEDSLVVRELRDSLYADDWLSGADTEAGVVAMLDEAQDVMGAAGMELAKCSSNSTVLCDKQSQVTADRVKVLGVTWCREDDSFSFTGEGLPADIVPTKRILLSLIAQVFDPLGLLAPFVVVLKCLFQELWNQRLDWDDVLSDEHAELVHRWLEGCQELKRIRVPRCYAALSEVDWSSSPDLDLQVFADASPKAYGCSAYLRIRQPDGSFSVSFVASKGRVAPLRQQLTLPRLELLACVMAAEMVRYVLSALRLPESTRFSCWSDSMIALGWLRGRPERWKTYVANRVKVIQRLTAVENWHHCRSAENPADLLTRGVSAETLITSSLWFRGPAWLADSDSSSCSEEDEMSAADSLPEEAGAGDVGVLTTVVTGTSDHDRRLLQVDRHGTLTRATRVMAWILRFVTNTKSASQRQVGELTAEELSAARLQLYREAQAGDFQEEVTLLREGKQLPKSSKILNLTPFLGEDGLLRVRGRLQFSDLSYEEKHPVILPKGYLSELIVREQHRTMKHAGVSTLITALRAELWVVGLRTIARRVVRSCVACRRLASQACCEPAAPLPADRVTRSRPFQVCGCDFAGPVYSVDFPNKKFWICLFCCSQVRAVHLELVDSLSLDDFMLAFRRFAARRGVPSVVYCDNAKTFHAAETLLQNYLGRLSPRFKFSVPLAPWWGGQFERLVGCVKSGLKRSVGQRHLTKAELVTVLTEVEACVNSRPLTFVGDSVDTPTPLTPNHFLTGHSVGFQARQADDPAEVSVGELRARSQVREKRLQKFWNVWSQQYVRSLPLSVRKFRSQGKLAEGAVVLLQDEKQPRLKWDLGVVTRLFPGRDGVSRSAEVRTAKGKKTRAVQRLHDLEVLPASEDA